MNCRRQLLEFQIRRLWCLFPTMSCEGIARLCGLTEPELRAELIHLNDLSYWSICAHGIWRMKNVGCTDGRFVGFPQSTPPVLTDAHHYRPTSSGFDESFGDAQQRQDFHNAIVSFEE